LRKAARRLRATVMTPAMYDKAALNGEGSVIRFYSDARVDVQKSFLETRIPFYTKGVRRLITDCTPSISAQLLALYGDTQRVLDAHAAGARIDIYDIDNLACRGEYETVLTLLERGAKCGAMLSEMMGRDAPEELIYKLREIGAPTFLAIRGALFTGRIQLAERLIADGFRHDADTIVAAVKCGADDAVLAMLGPEPEHHLLIKTLRQAVSAGAMELSGKLHGLYIAQQVQVLDKWLVGDMIAQGWFDLLEQHMFLHATHCTASPATDGALYSVAQVACVAAASDRPGPLMSILAVEGLAERVLSSAIANCDLNTTRVVLEKGCRVTDAHALSAALKCNSILQLVMRSYMRQGGAEVPDNAVFLTTAKGGVLRVQMLKGRNEQV
jgi:hypothetical protein